jgi:hypothetical protein
MKQGTLTHDNGVNVQRLHGPRAHLDGRWLPRVSRVPRGRVGQGPAGGRWPQGRGEPTPPPGRPRGALKNPNDSAYLADVGKGRIKRRYATEYLGGSVRIT